ncbi:MAG: hypothetical protein UH854_07380, partial [Clostridia bacterium]|nr:hypothetical protein [Clostridia bacterium]
MEGVFISNDKVVIKNAQVVLENGIIWDGIIVIDGDTISAVGTENDVKIPSDAQLIDAKGAYVGPGFVDIHVHASESNRTYMELKEASDYFLKYGSTTIMATPYYSMNMDEFVESLDAIKRSISEARTVKGIYLEGPYTNPVYGSNAWLNPWKHPINEDEYKLLVDKAGKLAKVWTIAPEREGINEFLEYARKVNPDVVFALGHSEATPEQIRNLGTKFRPKLMTHTFNATGRTGGSGGVRGYGPDEYCLANEDMYAELISDSCGIHVHSDLQRMLVKTKGYERIVLITDCTAPEGDTPIEYAHITDLNFDPHGGISGSKLTMNQA